MYYSSVQSPPNLTHYTKGSRKNPPPTVSQLQTLPVSRPVLLTLAILFEILYMLFTVWE